MPDLFTQRTGHPYQAASLADLPAELRQIVEPILGPTEWVDTIFVVPPQIVPRNVEGRGGGRHRLAEQALLFTAERVLHVQAAENNGAAGHAAWITAGQLFYARLMLILLYGRLELYGVEGPALKHIVMEYNTVAQALLQPALQRFLCRAWRTNSYPQSPQDDPTEAHLQALRQQSFKFGNGLPAYGLLPGAKLSRFAFQPRRVKRIGRIFQRLVAPAALLALTDGELVVIEEGRTSTTSYGWFITLCPQAYVASMEARTGPGPQTIGYLLRKEGVAIERSVTLEKDTAEAWISLWRQG